MDSPSVWNSIQNQPLLPPPPGVTPNIKDPESRAEDIFITAGICLALILLSAFIRLYAKITALRKWTSDDVTFLLGLSASLSYICLNIVAASGGVVGKHLWNVTFKQYNTKQLVLGEVFESIYGPCIWFVKLSLFILYLNIFGPLRWLRYLAYAGAVTTGLFYFSVMITYSVLCTPVSGHSSLDYLLALRSERCAVTRPLITTLGVVSLVSDLYLILLPLPAVWQLQLPFRRKLAVSAMFFTGSIACIASAFALAYRIQISQDSDATWLFVPLGIVTNIEFTAGVVVCCMPSTVTVFKSFKASMSSTIHSHRKALRLGSNSKDSKDFEMKEPANRKPTNFHRNNNDESVLANSLTPTLTRSEDSRMDWQRDY